MPTTRPNALANMNLKNCFIWNLFEMSGKGNNVLKEPYGGLLSNVKNTGKLP